jgi:2-haloacid dehalogenase
LARAYKPQPVVYLTSAAAFDCAPGEAMMVAAHSYDLAAAAAAGLRTAHVARPDERGKATGESCPNVPVDVSASSLLDLAEKLR